MTVLEPGKTWRKSSFSSPDGDCVEVDGSLEVVRDSKHPSSMLTMDVRVLVRMLRHGQIG